MAKRLSRRNFLQLSGASAALAASSLPLHRLYAASPRRQDAVNITFGGWGGTAEDEGVQAAIEVFQEENPGITVTWQHTPDAADFSLQLVTDIAAGTAPDTGFVESNYYETLRQQGLLVDITDNIMNDELLGQPDYFLPQEAARCADANGRWHGIGSCWVAPHIYYNAQLFDDEGLTPPGFKDEEIWDWDTFVETAKQLTVDVNGRHPDDNGFDPDNIERWGVDWPLWWVPIAAAVFSNNANYVNPDEPRLGLDSPEAIEAMQNLADLIYVHNVAPRSAAMADLGMTNTQMIDSGRLAMAIDGSWALAWMNPSMVSVPLSTGALPKMARPATFMQAHFHSVFASTQHPEESWQYVRFLSTPFYQTQFMKIGLWLPSQTALTTEEGLATWITEGIHPASHIDLVTSYLPQYGVTMRLPSGYSEASANFIDPAFQALAGGQPAELVFPQAVQQANDVIASMNPA
jgi:multiple sugar transport system substrate-binding protein